jgi:hypothetical protein
VRPQEILEVKLTENETHAVGFFFLFFKLIYSYVHTLFGPFLPLAPRQIIYPCVRWGGVIFSLLLNPWSIFKVWDLSLEVSGTQTNTIHGHGRSVCLSLVRSAGAW